MDPNATSAYNALLCGRKRWLLLDLTAAGSDWGPALGGDGIVDKHSMPRVANYFGQLSEDKKSEAGARGEVALWTELP